MGLYSPWHLQQSARDSLLARTSQTSMKLQATPTIDYVRPVDAASKDSLLTGASLNNTICIVGRNLRSVTKINFNDQAAVLNTSYMTDNTIIVIYTQRPFQAR